MSDGCHMYIVFGYPRAPHTICEHPLKGASSVRLRCPNTLACCWLSLWEPLQPLRRLARSVGLRQSV